MLFNSYTFLVLFMPAALIVVALLRRFGLSRYLIPFLTVASFVFYGYWNAGYVPLLVGSTLFNFLAGRAITRRKATPMGKVLMIGAVAANLSLLAYFKYTGFFAQNVNAALETALPVLAVALPLGISFFTFTQIEYLVDAHRGKAPEYALGEYALFVTFFPHLIAGPILRHNDVIPQFREELGIWSDKAFATGFLMLVIGLFKKTLVADSLAPWAEAAFGSVASLTFLDSWVGALSYTLQLYFDFSGYSDMAVGLALMLNVRLPFNFDSPYKARSIIDFWRRWHITLSMFLRNYLYIPLGGSRKGRARTILNLLITFILGGLWHGAGWTFVLWGAWHGALLSVNHAWRWTGRQLNEYAAWLLTFVAVVAGWVLFRSPDLATAEQYFAAMLGLGSKTAAISALPNGAIGVKIAVLAALTVATAVLPNSQEIAARMRPQWRWVLVVAGLFLVEILFIGGRMTTFLYYQF